MKEARPRIVIAGLSGDSGKTVLSLGLIQTWRQQKLKVTPFKKGPDFIDTAWLQSAAQSKAYILDTYLMGREGAKRNFLRHSGEISVIEGNRGIFDGFDTRGTHSTAQLATLLQAPVVIVMNVTKVTRTSAAFIKGVQTLDPELNLAGVVLNQVAGNRHLAIIRECIEEECNIPVLGHIPKIKDSSIIPQRHLGLITPGEYQRWEKVIDSIGRIVSENVNCKAILEIACRTTPLEIPEDETISEKNSLKIGYFRDSAFSFYYNENLEAFINRGVELVEISPLKDVSLPKEIDLLYIGGGFPETHAEVLSQNQALMHDIRAKVDCGLPVYAECGGLIYLCRELLIDLDTYPLCNIFPYTVRLEKKPQGHGYMQLKVDGENPFFPKGYAFVAHEFHYTTIIDQSSLIDNTVFSVLRGSGVGKGRDGLVHKNVLACYAHVIVEGNETWLNGILKAARQYGNSGKKYIIADCLN